MCAAGSCRTCPEGSELCQRCIDMHVSGKFGSHDYEMVTLPVAGTHALALLMRYGLKHSETVCSSHKGQPYTGLTCTECTAATTSPSGLCVECIKTHSAAYPLHSLRPSRHDASVIRELLNSKVESAIKGCFVKAASAATLTCSTNASASTIPQSPGDIAQASPLVSCARHKAVATQQELEALAGSIEAARLQLQANRDALVASAHESYETQLAALMSVGVARQMALQSEIVAADKALEASIEATSAASEVHLSLPLNLGINEAKS